jgi:UPF0755 protein
MRRLLIAVASLVAVGAAGFGGWMLALDRYHAPGPLTAARIVVVPRGTPATLAEALTEAGVIDGPMPFRIAVIATKGALRAGEFSFPEHASLATTLSILRTGRVVQHRLTIPEGLTAAQIAQILDRAPALEGDTEVPGEGEVLPETYAYTLDTTRTALIERAETAMTTALAKIWAERDPTLPLTSPDQLVTLASIVERETSRPEERAHVAAVFLNRLKLGMKLQSDPTTAYAASGGMTTYDRGLTRADLDAPNPYNTYTTPALPPGPICSPGLAAMQATAHPQQSNDLYFVANGTGGHTFAQTIEDHTRNVARWRALNGR